MPSTEPYAVNILLPVPQS